MVKNIINIGKLLKYFEKKGEKKEIRIIYLGFLYFFFLIKYDLMFEENYLF